MKNLVLAGRTIGDNKRPFIIAEVAQSHDGNLNFAHAFIDAVADAGANAIKFQTHIAAEETTCSEPWRIKFSWQDETRFDYWKRMEFSGQSWSELARHAAECGLVFLSSPFSLEAVDILENIDMQAWKIASGEVNNLAILEKVASTGKPVFLSSGMSSWSELDEAVNLVRKHKAPLAVFQCTSTYPCPPELLGLNVLHQLRDRYNCPVGISDHSGTIYGGLAAVALGALFIEVHVTFHRKMFGPDVSSSITFDELKELVRGSEFIADSLDNPVDKQKETEDQANMRSIFTKSIVARLPLSAGHILEIGDMAFKKPGNGIPVSEMHKIVGRKLKVNVTADAQFRWYDFE